MMLRLALVSRSDEQGCDVRWMDEEGLHAVGYSAPVQNRVKIRPGQLVAVDMEATPPAIVWRWFRGPVVYRVEDYVVVNNRVYQTGFRFPISVVRIPEAVEVEVGLDDEVFHSHGPDGVVIDTVVDGRPAHPARIAADLFPALEETYAEIRAREEA
jgi:hypothetical protein